jgi:membrane associated rhomboid family serine protease
MGIYDRDYYRNDKRSTLDPFSARTQVTIILVAINCVIWFIQLATSEPGPLGGDRGAFTNAFKIDVNKILQGEVWRLFTGAFLHDPRHWGHLAINMLILWWAGRYVEDIYGSREFLAFYLSAVFITSVSFVLFELAKGERDASAYGASGAVTAVLVVFAMHYPHRTILLFFFLPMPVWVLVIFQVVKDFIGITQLGLHSQPVAYIAHLSGAAFGFLYQYYSLRILNWLPSFRSTAAAKRRAAAPKVFRDPEPEPEPEPAATSAATAREPAASPSPASGSNVDEHLEAKLDEVLEKVKKHGQDSLSESEREILVRASEIYRRRRRS